MLVFMLLGVGCYLWVVGGLCLGVRGGGYVVFGMVFGIGGLFVSVGG